MKPQSLTVRIWSNLLPRRLLASTERTIAQCAWERKASPWSPLTLALSPALSPETNQGNAIQKNCASKIKLIFAGNCLGFSGYSSCGGRSKCKGSLDAALAVMDLWFPKFNFPSQHLHQHYPSSFLSTDRGKKASGRHMCCLWWRGLGVRHSQHTKCLPGIKRPITRCSWGQQCQQNVTTAQPLWLFVQLIDVQPSTAYGKPGQSCLLSAHESFTF